MEAQRLKIQKVCSIKSVRNKESIMVNSISQNAIQKRSSKIGALEKYEEKAKNLERNFQRFVDKYKSTHRPQLKVTLNVPEEIVITSESIIELGRFLEKLSIELRPMLSITDTTKFERIIIICNKTIKSLSNYNSHDKELTNALDHFEMSVGILEKLMQSICQYLPDKELKTLKNTNMMSITSTIKENILKSKVQILTSTLSRTLFKNSNKAIALKALKDKNIRHQFNVKAKRFVFNLIIKKMKERDLIILKRFNSWRLSCIKNPRPYLNFVAFIYQEIINANILI